MICFVQQLLHLFNKWLPGVCSTNCIQPAGTNEIPELERTGAIESSVSLMFPYVFFILWYIERTPICSTTICFCSTNAYILFNENKYLLNEMRICSTDYRLLNECILFNRHLFLFNGCLFLFNGSVIVERI